MLSRSGQRLIGSACGLHEYRAWCAPSLAAGGAFGWCFAHTGAWPLQILALAWLAHRLHPGARAPWLGTIDAAAFGLAMHAAGLWWIPYGLHREWPQQPIWPAMLVLVAIGLMRALVPVAFRALAFAARPLRAEALTQTLAFGLGWTSIEMLCADALNLPMLGLGYGQIDGPMAGVAPILGVHGVSLLASIAAWLAAQAAWQALRWRSWRVVAGHACAAALVAGLGAAAGMAQWTRPAREAIRVAAMQDGLSRVTQYTTPGQASALRTLEQWGGDLPGTLLIGAETQIPASMLGAAQRSLAAAGATALVGSRLRDASGWTNSVVAIGARGNGYRYDKRVLIPFGEYTPSTWLGSSLGRLLSYTDGNDLRRGRPDQPDFLDRGVGVVTTICFENFFPLQSASRISAKRPRILANLADMAIFSGTAGMRQDIAVNRMLALSLQTPMVRGSDNGPTMLIGSGGRVLAAAPDGVPAVLPALVTPRSGLTPYARIMRWMAASRRPADLARRQAGAAGLNRR